MKNRGITIFLKFLVVIISLLLLEILFFIKFIDLDTAVYLPLIMIINMNVVFIFWWRNKESRGKATIASE